MQKKHETAALACLATDVDATRSRLKLLGHSMLQAWWAVWVIAYAALRGEVAPLPGQLKMPSNLIM